MSTLVFGTPWRDIVFGVPESTFTPGSHDALVQTVQSTSAWVDRLLSAIPRDVSVYTVAPGYTRERILESHTPLTLRTYPPIVIIRAKKKKDAKGGAIPVDPFDGVKFSRSLDTAFFEACDDLGVSPTFDDPKGNLPRPGIAGRLVWLRHTLLKLIGTLDRLDGSFFVCVDPVALSFSVEEIRNVNSIETQIRKIEEFIRKMQQIEMKTLREEGRVRRIDISRDEQLHFSVGVTTVRCLITRPNVDHLESNRQRLQEVNIICARLIDSMVSELEWKLAGNIHSALTRRVRTVPPEWQAGYRAASKALNNEKPWNTGRHLFLPPPILTMSAVRDRAHLILPMSYIPMAVRFRGLQVGALVDRSINDRVRMDPLNPGYLFTIGSPQGMGRGLREIMSIAREQLGSLAHGTSTSVYLTSEERSFIARMVDEDEVDDIIMTDKDHQIVVRENGD